MPPLIASNASTLIDVTPARFNSMIAPANTRIATAASATLKPTSTNCSLRHRRRRSSAHRSRREVRRGVRRRARLQRRLEPPRARQRGGAVRARRQMIRHAALRLQLPFGDRLDGV